MDELERALRAALAREPAPSGFAKRVLTKAKAQRVLSGNSWRAPAWRWAAAAVLVAACVSGGLAEYRSLQRIRGMKAREQVLLALRITGSRLHAIQMEVAKSSRREGERR